MTSAFLIGGFNTRYTIVHSEKIKLLKRGLETRGYRVVLADITWQRKTPSQFATEFEKIYNVHCTEHNIVIGNSFGAVVAMLAAPALAPDRLYLCSLSPFFKEDRDKYPDSYSIKRFGKRRMHDLWSLPCTEIAKQYHNLDTKVTITYGEQEKEMYPHLVHRCKQAAAAIPRAKLIELPSALHSMSDPAYTSEILKLIPDARHVVSA